MTKKLSFLLVLSLIFVGFMAKADSDKSITVLEPNGGEIWEAGMTYRVTWESTGHDKLMAAVVCGGETIVAHYNIVSNATSSSSNFSLSSGQTSQSRCKAVVAESNIGDFDNIEDGISGDYSDANFKISGTGTTISGAQSIEDYLKAQADLIKDPAGRVYKLIDSYKLWLSNGAFAKLGYNLADADSLTQTEINEYPRLKLAEVPGSVMVYYLTEGGRKRAIPNSEVFDSYDNDWNDVVEIEKNVLDAFPDVELIRAEGDYKVYELKNGVKRWIKTAEEFNRLEYDWCEVAPVNSIELDVYNEGEAIGDVVEDDIAEDATEDAPEEITGISPEDVEGTTPEDVTPEDTEGTEVQRDVNRVADLSQIVTALGIHHNNNATYPVALSDLVPESIVELPLDPTTNENYLYVQLSSGESYHLGGTLENPDSPLLAGDADYDSSEEGGFNGQDSVYDLVP